MVNIFLPRFKRGFENFKVRGKDLSVSSVTVSFGSGVYSYVGFNYLDMCAMILLQAAYDGSRLILRLTSRMLFLRVHHACVC